MSSGGFGPDASGDYPKFDPKSVDGWLGILQMIGNILKITHIGGLHDDQKTKPADKPTGDPVKDFS